MSTTASEVQAAIEPITTTDSDQYNLPREMVMSQRDFKLFLVALDSDEEPNDKLKTLFDDRA